MGEDRPEYEWTDRDEDSKATLEAWRGHPHIVATLRLAGGPDDAQVGIYIDVDQAWEIIDYLTTEIRDGDHYMSPSTTPEGSGGAP